MYIDYHLNYISGYKYFGDCVSKLSLGSKCAYIESICMRGHCKWKYTVDCTRSKKAKYHLVGTESDKYGLCNTHVLNILNRCYVIVEIHCWQPQHPISVPSSLNQTKSDSKEQALSEYLAKAPEHLTSMDIFIKQIDGVNNYTYLVYRKVAYDSLPYWFLTSSDATEISSRLISCQGMTVVIKCHYQEYRCTEGTCILSHHQCDGVIDCPDGSDEIKCIQACNQEHQACFSSCHLPSCHCSLMYFQCPHGQCIPISKLCDGIQQCYIYNEESSCEYKRYIPIFDEAQYINQHLEGYGSLGGSHMDYLPTDMACVYSRSLKLDMSLHLKYCYSHDCPGMYKCYHSYCIPIRYICDGINDCPAEEDERQCRILRCPGLLKCKDDAICLMYNEVCDGAVHCILSMDDEIHCDISQCPSECQCFELAMECSNGHQTFIPQFDQRVKAINLPNNKCPLVCECECECVCVSVCVCV